MKIVLATGVNQLDAGIEGGISNATFVGNALYKEAVISVISRRNPDIIILSDLLEGTTPMRELLLTIRTQYPDLRIIFIMKEDNPREKSFLYSWAIFDVIVGSFNLPQLQHLLLHKKEFKDVHSEMNELKPYQRGIDLVSFEDDVSGLEHINREDYERIDGPQAGTDTLYQQIVSYWSVLDQSGKTFSIINTALALGGRKELKILLIDYNLDNPSMNLYFSFVDPNKNLGAMIDDVENGQEITKDNLDTYLITHPTYKNVKILSGNILTMRRRDDTFMYELFEQIIDASQKSNFSTILVDMKSGLDDLNVNIIKRSSRVLMHVSETPGSLNALRVCFNPEAGPFVEKLIDKRKFVPVITRSHDETRVKFKQAVEYIMSESNAKLRVGAIIDEFEEVRESLFKGVPLLSRKTKEHIYDTFVIMSNLVHKNIFLQPLNRKGTKGTTATPNKPAKKGLFSKKPAKKK